MLTNKRRNGSLVCPAYDAATMAHVDEFSIPMPPSFMDRDQRAQEYIAPLTVHVPVLNKLRIEPGDPADTLQSGYEFEFRPVADTLAVIVKSNGDAVPLPRWPELLPDKEYRRVFDALIAVVRHTINERMNTVDRS